MLCSILGEYSVTTVPLLYPLWKHLKTALLEAGPCNPLQTCTPVPMASVTEGSRDLVLHRANNPSHAAPSTSLFLFIKGRFLIILWHKSAFPRTHACAGATLVPFIFLVLVQTRETGTKISSDFRLGAWNMFKEQADLRDHKSQLY